MKADEILKKGAEILKQRGSEYETTGESERSFQAVADCFNAKTGKFITAAEVALLLQDLKDVRQWSQDRLHEDSVIDCVNYAALKGEELYKQYGNESIISDKFDAALADGNNAFNLIQSVTEVNEKYKRGEASISDVFDAADAMHEGAFASKNTKLSLAKFFALGFELVVGDVVSSSFYISQMKDYNVVNYNKKNELDNDIFIEFLDWRSVDAPKDDGRSYIEVKWGDDKQQVWQLWRPDLKKLIELHGE